MKNIDVLFILGTGYCGSTALEMALGVHTKLINVGEVNRVLLAENKQSLDIIFNGRNIEDKNNLCSCGNLMPTCTYWSGFYDILVQNMTRSFFDKYLLHLEYFKSKFPDAIMIDPSKSLSTLKEINSLVEKKKVLPLLLVKDVRNWTTSVQKKHGGHAVKRYIRWYIEHKKILTYLNKTSEYIQFGYEEFALFPKIVLQKITGDLGISFEESMIFPYENSGHAVISNRMRYDKNKKSQIFYDYRWFMNKNLNLASLLFPFIMKFNNKIVYSNRIIENNFNYAQ